MITAFEVGAVFKIINRASPTLTAILRQVRALNAEITKAKLSLADLGKPLSTTGIKVSIAETDTLAASWRSVATAAGQARVAIGAASTAATRGGAVAAIGGGGRHRPGWLSAHASGPGVPLPGGAHLRIGGGTAAVGLGGLAWGIDQSMHEQDAIARAEYAAGLAPTPENNKRFADMIEETMRRTGYSVSQVSEAMVAGVRMLQGVEGGGLDILPDLMVSAATEARNKPGTTMEEAMNASVGLAHMTKEYDPAKIRSLMRDFAFLSTTVPGSLDQMERSLSYSVPILQSGMGIDPSSTMLLGAALQRAGVTNTKSGTWIREALQKALPGTALQSGTSYKAHEEALRKLGLVDADGKPTWFTNGKPDALKFFEMAGDAVQSIPLEERGAIERQAFGVRGAGAVSVLSDPAVLAQVHALEKIRDSEAFKNRYASFTDQYAADSPLQKSRIALQELNLNLMKLGSDVLPAVNKGLSDLIGVLDRIRHILPGASTSKAAATVGARAFEGAGIGAGLGVFMGGVGAPAGALIGAGTGTVFGLAEQYMDSRRKIDKLGASAADTAERLEKLGGAVRGLPPNIAGWATPTPTPAPAPPGAIHPISFSLNVDGRTLAQAVSEQLSHLMAYPTGAPVGNDSSRWASGDAYSDDI